MQRTKKYRNTYSEAEISAAVLKVRRKEMGLNKAAKHFGVPRSTIRSRLQMKDREIYRSGRMSILTQQEEDELEQWIFDMQRRGFPVTKDMLQNSVKQFLDSNPRENTFVDNRPGKKWLQLFLRRRPKVTLRTPEFITNASAKVSPDDIRSWFKKVEAYLTDKELLEILNDPRRLLNGDETNFQLNPKSKAVLALKGSRNVYDVERCSSKLNVTVMFTFHASGETVPPTIIYPYKSIPQEVVRSVPPSWGIAKSDNGWMTSIVFRDYIRNVLNPYLEQKQIKKPVIFIIDGHSSHINLETSKMCQEMGIILIALNPNVTRVMQPADVSAFKPLKNGWPKAVARYRKEDPLRKITMQNFAIVLQDCLRNSLTVASVKYGFRASGLYPCDCNAIDFSKCMATPAVNEQPSEVLMDNSSVNENSSLPMNGHNKAKRALERCASVIGLSRIKKFKGDFVIFDNPDEEALFAIFQVLQEALPETIAALEECSGDAQKLDLNNITMAFNVSDVQAEIIDMSGNSVPELQNQSINSSAINGSVIEADMSGNSVSGTLNRTLKDCLNIPPSLQRENKREYRSKRYHVLTLDEFVREYSHKEEEKRRLEAEKENRKKIREERKVANDLKKKEQEKKKALKKVRK